MARRKLHLEFVMDSSYFCCTFVWSYVIQLGVFLEGTLNWARLSVWVCVCVFAACRVVWVHQITENFAPFQKRCCTASGGFFLLASACWATIFCRVIFKLVFVLEGVLPDGCFSGLCTYVKGRCGGKSQHGIGFWPSRQNMTMLQYSTQLMFFVLFFWTILF